MDTTYSVRKKSESQLRKPIYSYQTEIQSSLAFLKGVYLKKFYTSPNRSFQGTFLIPLLHSCEKEQMLHICTSACTGK